MNTKQGILLAVAVNVIGGFSSCNKDSSDSPTPTNKVLTFEELSLSKADTFWNGSDKSGKFTSQGVNFINSYNETWGSWKGFSYSDKKDKLGKDWNNQYSVYNSSEGAETGEKFVIANGQGATIKFSKATKVVSLLATNGAYPYWAMKEGNQFSEALDADDWFKARFMGYKEAGKATTDTVDFFLAEKGKIVTQWTKVDLSKLGAVDSLKIYFDGTKKNSHGLTTPLYVFIDNLEIVP